VELILKISKDKIKQINNVTMERYNKRFEKYGLEAKTLGWGSKKDQLTRFETATIYVNFAGKSVLDIGCGFADFYEFLINNDIKIKRYEGIDINDKLIEVAKKRFQENRHDDKKSRRKIIWR